MYLCMISNAEFVMIKIINQIFHLFYSNISQTYFIHGYLLLTLSLIFYSPEIPDWIICSSSPPGWWASGRKVQILSY